MAVRKPALNPAPHRPELEQLIENARKVGVTDEQLQEQRVSFAYGNAPTNSRITKDSVRHASRGIRIAHA